MNSAGAISRRTLVKGAPKPHRFSPKFHTVQGRAPLRERISLREAPAPGTPEYRRITAHFGRLRNEFGVVVRKIDELSQLPCLRSPGFAKLRQLASETHQLSLLLCSEFHQAAAIGTTEFPDPDWIDQLIECCSDYQDRLQRQLALVAQLREDAIMLRDELHALVTHGREQSGSLVYDGIQSLSRRIISELVYDVTPPVLHQGLALDVLTEMTGSRAESEIYAVALASAQTVARVARVTWLREDQVELVTAAALLQDCGKMLTARSEVPLISLHNPNSFDHHPLVGSAMVTNYRKAPDGLAMLIAQHHERLDGTGMPRQLGSRQLNGFSRLLAAASRLERLRLRRATDHDLMAAPDRAEGPAMVQLWYEALEGAWDLGLCRKLLIQRDTPTALRTALDSRNWGMQTSLQEESPEKSSSIPGPHFSQRKLLKDQDGILEPSFLLRKKTGT